MWPQVQLTSWNFSKLAKCRNCSPISSLAHVLGGLSRHWTASWRQCMVMLLWCIFSTCWRGSEERHQHHGKYSSMDTDKGSDSQDKAKSTFSDAKAVHCTDISSYHPSMPITIMWAAVPTSPCSSWFFDFNSLLLTCPDYLGSSVPLGRLATSKVPFTP